MLGVAYARHDGLSNTIVDPSDLRYKDSGRSVEMNQLGMRTNENQRRRLSVTE
jgi:hypothetical protein